MPTQKVIDQNLQHGPLARAQTLSMHDPDASGVSLNRVVQEGQEIFSSDVVGHVVQVEMHADHEIAPAQALDESWRIAVTQVAQLFSRFQVQVLTGSGFVEQLVQYGAFVAQALTGNGRGPWPVVYDPGFPFQWCGVGHGLPKQGHVVIRVLVLAHGDNTFTKRWRRRTIASPRIPSM